MSTLTLQTPYTLGPCGCLLETGDRDQPLFVPCRTHHNTAPNPVRTTAAAPPLVGGTSRTERLLTTHYWEPAAVGPGTRARTRGVVVVAKAAFHCSGAGANGFRRTDAHPRGFQAMAGSASFRFTREFHYDGARYTAGCRVCLTHARAMGLIQPKAVA